MAKKKSQVKLVNKGIYSKWESSSKDLPKLIKVTNSIPCELDVEFGYIVNVQKSKNKKLRYCIYHPDIPGDDGEVMPPFSGEEYIKQNDWNFFIGDTIWAPVENKMGSWRITLELEGTVVADETFELCYGPIL